MQIDVLCVGLATYDLVFQVGRHPGEDEKCFASGLFTCGGGPGANAAVTVVRLGGSAAFAGYLGRDVFGEMHLEELASEGVMTSLIVRDKIGEAAADDICPRRVGSPLSAIIVKPGGKKTVVTHKGRTPVIEPGLVDFSRLSPRAILFDGHQPALSVPLAVKAREQNIPAILDAGSVHDGTVQLARICSHLVASEKFARDFSGEKDPVKALGFLGRIAPVAVITLGDAGLVYRESNGSGPPGGEPWDLSASPARMDAFPVDALDTTGAGDIFHGAFALTTARGDALRPALKYASAAAALGCVKMGARPAIPTAAQVESLLRNAGYKR